MRKIALFLSIAIILINTGFVHAQNRFRPEILFGPSLNSNYNGRIFSNWGNGIILGGGIVYQLFPSFDLAFEASYQSYPYQGDNLDIVLVDFGMGRQHYSSSGKRSSMVETSFTLRNSQKNSSLYPIFSLRAGAFRTNLGEIIITQWRDNDPENISESTYYGSGKVDIKSFAALGFGLGLKLNSNLRVLAESRLTQTFDLEQTLIQIVLTLQFNLRKQD
jgi:hypothetical protein